MELDLTGGAIVDYISGDIEKAKRYSKIGNTPLVVKALKVANESDLIISNKDTKRIALILNLLEKQKVAVLL